MTTMRKNLGFAILWAAALAVTSIPGTAMAEKKYGPGASDTEIKIGNTSPYSGSLSAFGVVGKLHTAYFKMINAKGGINGRRINFISYDDAMSPPKTVEQIRKLVESDEVLFIFNPQGTLPNSAVKAYLNNAGVPQLFVGSGFSMFADPQHFPWTMGFQPPLQLEARILAKYLLKNKPDAKVAVIYQNDDFGRDSLKGLKDGLGEKTSMIVAEASYQVSDPTIDSVIVTLKSSGADTLVQLTTPKFAAQAIRTVASLKWNVFHLLNSSAESISSTMKPAGFENAQGIISTSFFMDPTDPQWADNPGMKEFKAFMKEWYPEGDPNDRNVVYGYMVVRTLAHVLEKCGDNLTRENIMKQAANIKDFDPGPTLPGILVNTSPTRWTPINQNQMKRFEGEGWKVFGPIINAD